MVSEKYKIDAGKIIRRLIPFYANGRKINLLLSSISSPIENLHKKWMCWAEERIIESSITSQPMSIAWYLTHKLKSHFINGDDEFMVSNGLDVPENILYTMDEYMESNAYSCHIYCDTENMESTTMTIRSPLEVMEKTTSFIVFPPEIEETADYDNSDYRAEIINLVDKYNTSFKNYQINV